MSLLNEPKAEPLTQRQAQQLEDAADALVVPVTGYVEKVGTMATTFAVEEWDGGITRISIPSRLVYEAYQDARAGEGGDGE